MQKRLAEQGLLESHEHERLTVKRSVEGHRRRVLHLRSEDLLEARAGGDGTLASGGACVPQLSAPIPPDAEHTDKPGDEL
jgi:hypothetical protein